MHWVSVSGRAQCVSISIRSLAQYQSVSVLLAPVSVSPHPTMPASVPTLGWAPVSLSALVIRPASETTPLVLTAPGNILDFPPVAVFQMVEDIETGGAGGPKKMLFLSNKQANSPPPRAETCLYE